MAMKNPGYFEQTISGLNITTWPRGEAGHVLGGGKLDGKFAWGYRGPEKRTRLSTNVREGTKRRATDAGK